MTQPTINDDARIAGLSEIGYAPNPQARAVQRNLLIALIHDCSDPQLTLLAEQGMQAALEGSAYALVVQPVAHEARAAEALRLFLELHRPAGALLLPPLAESETLAAICEQAGVRAIGIAAPARRTSAPAMASNERKAVADAIGYLIALGHERIGIVAGPDLDASAQARELGYLDAMADHELDRGPALIASGDFSFESGYAAGKLLLEVSPRPTAIFAAGDAMAAGVLHAAHAQGLAVPRNLSIVGFGDTPLAAQLWPPLSTIRLPVREMAQAATMRLIADGDAPPSLPFAAEFIPRATTAPMSA